jgi:hypothetical protein
MVHVRKTCSTEILSIVNEGLTDVQRQHILNTPFKYLVDMSKKLDVCTPLLEIMANKWDEGSYGF